MVTIIDENEYFILKLKKAIFGYFQMSVVEVLGKITEPTIRCFVNKARATVSSASFSSAGLF